MAGLRKGGKACECRVKGKAGGGGSARERGRKGRGGEAVKEGGGDGGEGGRREEGEVTCDHPRRHRQAPGRRWASSPLGLAAGGTEKETSAALLTKRPSFSVTQHALHLMTPRESHKGGQKTNLTGNHHQTLRMKKER